MPIDPIGHTDLRRPHVDTTRAGHTDAITTPHTDTPRVHTDVEKIHADVAPSHTDFIEKVPPE